MGSGELMARKFFDEDTCLACAIVCIAAALVLIGILLTHYF